MEIAQTTCVNTTEETNEMGDGNLDENTHQTEQETGMEDELITGVTSSHYIRYPSRERRTVQSSTTLGTLTATVVPDLATNHDSPSRHDTPRPALSRCLHRSSSA